VVTIRLSPVQTALIKTIEIIVTETVTGKLFESEETVDQNQILQLTVVVTKLQVVRSVVSFLANAAGTVNGTGVLLLVANASQNHTYPQIVVVTELLVVRSVVAVIANATGTVLGKRVGGFVMANASQNKVESSSWLHALTYMME